VSGLEIYSPNIGV